MGWCFCDSGGNAMVDLVSKNKISVRAGGSLHARIAEAELRSEVAPQALSEVNISTLPNRLVIMIDQSGSMNGEPIKLLENAVQDFIQKSNPSDTAIAVESFPEGTSIEMTNDKMKLWMLCMGLRASGGTPMGSTMEKCLHLGKMTRAIIISDGQPDCSPKNQTLEYKKREIPVDTVHIGDSEMGVDVLKEISEITGGLFVKFKDIKSFSTAFAFLLPETRVQAAQLFLTAGANEVK
jgi:Mg-chelatase subunit ChlD